MSTRVFCYLRVSTAGQVDGDGFPRQEEACRAFAAKQGWEVARVFYEQQSGSDSYADRKFLAEALDLASFVHIPDGRGNAVGIDTIIVERADRLSRDLIVAELFLQKCKERGVKVYTADSGEEIVNSDGNPTRTLIRQVLGAVAQFDKSSIVQKMQAGRKAKSERTGAPCGGPKPSHYGDRGGVAQQNEERKIIQQMVFLRRVENRSYEFIADRLRRARIRCPNGDWGRRVRGVNPAWTWSGKMVERILRRWENREI